MPETQDIKAMVDALAALGADLDLVRRHTKGASVRNLLRIIVEHDGIRPSAIADRLQIDRSLAGRRVRECQQSGFVSVTPDPSDGRSSVVRIEPAGTAELDRLSDLNTARFGRVVADWDTADVRTLADLLDRLRTALTATSAGDQEADRSRTARAAGEPAWLADFLAG